MTYDKMSSNILENYYNSDFSSKTVSDKNIIRIRKGRENPYFVCNKEFFSDPRLSWKAKGILGYLLSKPDNWILRIGDLINQSKDGRDSNYSGINELIEFGYIVRKIVRDNRGQYLETAYIIYEKPETLDTGGLNPITENPYTENPYYSKYRFIENKTTTTKQDIVSSKGEIIDYLENVVVDDLNSHEDYLFFNVPKPVSHDNTETLDENRFIQDAQQQKLPTPPIDLPKSSDTDNHIAAITEHIINRLAENSNQQKSVVVDNINCKNSESLESKNEVKPAFDDQTNMQCQNIEDVPKNHKVEPRANGSSNNIRLEVIVEKVTKEARINISPNTIRNLVNNFGEARVLEKVENWHKLKDMELYNPAGFFISAVREDYMLNAVKAKDWYSKPVQHRNFTQREYDDLDSEIMFLNMRDKYINRDKAKEKLDARRE